MSSSPLAKNASQTKLPFIIVNTPLSEASDDTNSNKNLKPQNQPKIASPKVSKTDLLRNAAVQKHVAARTNPTRIISGYSQLRSSPRSLYPHSSSEDIFSQVEKERNIRNDMKEREEAIRRFRNKIRDSSRKLESYDELLAFGKSNILPPIDSKISGGNKNEIHANLKSRVNDLSCHIEDRDAEIHKLKADIEKLRKMVDTTVKEGKDSKLVHQSLRRSLLTLEDQLETLEDRVACQETESIERILTQTVAETKIDNEKRNQAINFKNVISSTSSSSQESVVVKPSEITPDFDKIIEQIFTMNRMIENYQSLQLVYGNSSECGSAVATFKYPDAVKLTLYKNGLILSVSNSPFRKYDNPSVVRLLQDIHELYFPAELHRLFPEGVIILVEDKRNVIYGNGHRGRTIASSIDALPKLTPIEVARKQKIFASKKCSSSNTASNITPSQLNNESKITELPPLFHESNSSTNKIDKIITLKLKCISSGKWYKMKTSSLTTIGRILTHLEKNLEKGSTSRYYLVCPLPTGIFSDISATLLSYGINENSLLYIHTKKKDCGEV